MMSLSRFVNVDTSFNPETREIHAACVCRLDGCKWENEIVFEVAHIKATALRWIPEFADHLRDAHQIIFDH